MLTLGLILCVINMDANGLSTIFPTISDDLHAGNTISWATSSSLISTTVFSVSYGRMSDIFGRRALFVGACALFAIAELVAGFSSSPAMLYVMRALAGIASGGVGSMALVVASDVVKLEERGKWQGVCGSFMALGNVIGPFISAGISKGLASVVALEFVHANASRKHRSTWRGYFWLLSPLGVISAVLAGWLLPKTTPPDGFLKNLYKIDFLGCLTSSIAIIFLLLPISGGGTYYTWDSPMVVSMLVIGFLSLGVFLVVEWRFARLPIIPLTIFRTREVCALMAQVFGLGWSYTTCITFLPLYYQNLRGWTALASAGLLTPIIGIQVIVSAVAGRYVSRKKRYAGVIRLGFCVYLVGSGLMIIFDGKTHPAICVIILLLAGIGVGCCTQSIIVALQAHTPKSQRAVVLSCRNFFRFLGAACGVVASSAILQRSLKEELPSRYKRFADSSYALPPLTDASRSAVLAAYATAIRHVFISNASIMLVTALGCFFWKDYGLDTRPEDEHVIVEAKEPQENVHKPARRTSQATSQSDSQCDHDVEAREDR
ncbi:hypothetical protein ACLMJK_003856 [Lecanora helva]